MFLEIYGPFCVETLGVSRLLSGQGSSLLETGVSLGIFFGGKFKS